MKKLHARKGGFTLTELMIVVALIGLLSAIAIPNFVAFQARGRRAEAYTNVASIARAYIAYSAEQGSFPDMLTHPNGGQPTLPDFTAYPQGLGTTKLPWDLQTQTFFDVVGWQSEGPVFYTYDVNSAACFSCTLCFTVTATGDVDDDGVVGAVMYVHPQRDSGGAVIGDCPSRVGTRLPPVGPSGTLYDQPAVVFVDADDF
jgi:prepilin-type N-terminal cleavage/methylation domain-containing protein